MLRFLSLLLTTIFLPLLQAQDPIYLGNYSPEDPIYVGSHEAQPIYIGENYRTDLKSVVWQVGVPINKLPRGNEIAQVEPNRTELSLEPIRNTVLGQLNAIIQEDIPRAYFGFTTKAFRDNTPMETYAQFVRGYANYWNGANFQWDGIVFHEDVAILKATFSSDSKVKNGTYFLKQEGGQWRIMGMTMLDPPPSAPRQRDIFNQE